VLAQGAQSVRQLTPKIVENHDCAVTFSSFVFSRPCFVVVVAAVAVVVVLFLLVFFFSLCEYGREFLWKRTAETARERKKEAPK
jgi:hypothetical protein